MIVGRVLHQGVEGLATSSEAKTFKCVFPGGPVSDAAVLDLADKKSLDGPTVELSASELKFLLPLRSSPKIICVGLNYRDHAKEAGLPIPSYPTIFTRFGSSLVGHGEPILLSRLSEQLDYEAELVAVIGKPGRNISRENALSHVVGYSIFNDASFRDYQLKTSQWTVGKNFDATGAFGPWIVTSDQLPPGCAGLILQTRLNGTVVQRASIDDMIFDIATLVSTLSEAFTLERGDILVTGTPAGVGFARKPQLWMKPGDVCEVEIDRIAVLRNEIVADDR